MHHTGSKGDIGVARAIADLIERGYDVMIPFDSTSPFDLIAYKDKRFIRISVKYRKTAKGGTLAVPAERTIIANSKIVRTANREIDLICIFHPDSGRCYYLLPSPSRNVQKIRVTPTLNGQRKGVTMLSDLTEIPDIAS
jgi:hypothetical protein